MGISDAILEYLINDDKTYLNLLKIAKKVKTYMEVLLKCNEFTMFLFPTLPKIYFLGCEFSNHF